MKVAVALRGLENSTDKRPKALAQGLREAGCEIVEISRGGRLPDGTELLVQAGFARTNPIMEAIGVGIPYIIAEEAFLRHFKEWQPETWVSYAYGGLNGGGTWAESPAEEVWKPPLGEMRPEYDSVAIVSQMPADHSLRGIDHYTWIREQLERYPDAEVRPHPKMVPQKPLEPLTDFLGRIGKVITFSSTMGAEALYRGIPSEACHYGSMAYKVRDREKWAHDLSYRHWPLDVAATARVGEQMLKGYEAARERAQNGGQEVPREKVRSHKNYHYPEDIAARFP